MKYIITVGLVLICCSLFRIERKLDKILEKEDEDEIQ